jgi:hypothetical protein
MIFLGYVLDTVTIGGSETFRLVSYKADTIGDSVRLTWANIGATEYYVHYDSSATGPFTSFYTVSAPETSLVVATTPAAGRRFYYVTGYWPETVREAIGNKRTEHPLLSPYFSRGSQKGSYEDK